MAATKCAACGREVEGRFCSWCGAALDGRHCTECGALAEPGARFCNACGAPLGAGPAAAPRAGAGKKRSGGMAPRSRPGGAPADAAATTQGSRTVWWVAGALMVALILAVALPAVRSDPEEPAGAGSSAGMAGPAAGGAGAVDLSSMTPRQAADRLYERIMTTASAGDSAGAAFFLPMAVQAYDRARPLDADGLFHLSLLQRMAGDPQAGLAVAREALAVHPNHLLNMASAAGAAAEAGDSAAAAGYYEQLLAAWEEELAKGLPEYEMHSAMLPEIRQQAESFTGG